MKMRTVNWMTIILLLLQGCDNNKDDSKIYEFTPADVTFLQSLNLSALPPLPSAPDNRVADDLAAATFGKALFFDGRLSRSNSIACATCHQPEKFFTDGLALSVASGVSTRSAPSLFGAAYSPWQYWDGRKDSLWSQALAPIEHPAEQNLSRAEFVTRIIEFYNEEYEAVFGPIDPLLRKMSAKLTASPLGDSKAQAQWDALSKPQQRAINQVFANAGKALMAFQRRIRLEPARFDRFVSELAENNLREARRILTPSEVKGLRLFSGKANCISCHNGPWFTNFEFHNIGAPEPNKKAVDMGRHGGVASLASDEFTCLSQWSDAQQSDCEELQFLKREGMELVGAFKTPTLRNIAATAPYMQAGQFKDLKAVLDHYNLPNPPFYDREQHPSRPHFDIMPLALTEEEMDDIIAFLGTLTSPLPEAGSWAYRPSKAQETEVSIR